MMAAHKKKPLGKPLELTDEELDEMSTISPQDIEEAKAHARRYGSKRFNEMLNAGRPAGNNAV